MKVHSTRNWGTPSNKKWEGFFSYFFFFLKKRIENSFSSSERRKNSFSSFVVFLTGFTHVSSTANDVSERKKMLCVFGNVCCHSPVWLSLLRSLDDRLCICCCFSSCLPFLLLFSLGSKLNLFCQWHNHLNAPMSRRRGFTMFPSFPSSSSSSVLWCS